MSINVNNYCARDSVHKKPVKIRNKYSTKIILKLLK